MKKIIFITLLTFLTFNFIDCKNNENPKDVFHPDYKQVDEANALKGFVPFAGESSAIPSSMEFFCIPLNQIEKEQGVYDFTVLENNISQIANRGHQAIFRVYLDYPGLESGTPSYYWQQGIPKLEYVDPDTNKTFSFPDYTNQKCIDFLCNFISELGKKYDGDERIGFIFCGLIGHWGEWHNYYYTLSGNSDHMPDETQQAQLYQSFSDSFKKTFVLTRNPTATSLLNFERIGFHDDSFTEDTIDDSKGWYFVTQLQNNNLMERWKTAPIGGEFRPENQVPFLNGKKYAAYYQDYDECLEKTHCSWLLYNAAFTSDRTDSQKKKGWEASKKLGYDLFCSKVEYKIESSVIKLNIEISNIGFAPFYYNWQPVVQIIKNGEILKTYNSPFENWDITSVSQNESKIFSAELNIEGISSEDLSESKIIFGIPNPMTKGPGLKFSNKSLSQDKAGFITLKN